MPIADRRADGDYGEALKNLRDAGYIVINGEAPEQTTQLIPGGAGVVQLANPA